MEAAVKYNSFPLASTAIRVVSQTGTQAPVLTLLILLFVFPADLYSGHFGYRNIGMNEGMPTNTVYDLVKDSRGFYWAGTNAGLVQLYADRIRVYGLAEGLPGILVRAVAEDGDGNLWLGIQGEGIVMYDGKNFNKVIPADSLPGDRIHRIHYSKEREMLLIAGDNGFASLRQGDYRLYLSEQMPGEARIRVFDFLETDSFIYLTASVSGLFKYYPGRDEPIVHIPRHHGISSFISAYVTSAGDTIWAPGNVEFIVRHCASDITRLNGISETVNMTEDEEGNLYLAAKTSPFSELGGVFMVKGDTLLSVNKLYGLQATSVNRVIYDPSDKALIIADGNLGLFVLYPRVIENGSAGLPPPDNLNIKSFATTDDGTFWILDENDLWYRKPGGNFRRFDKTALTRVYLEFLEKEFAVKYSYMLDPEGSYEKYSKLQASGEYSYKNPYSTIINNEQVIYPDHVLYQPRYYSDLINTGYEPFKGLYPGEENSLWIMSNAGYFRLDAKGNVDYYNNYYSGERGFIPLQNNTIISHASNNMLIHRIDSLPGVTHFITDFQQPALRNIMQVPGGLIVGCRNKGLILIHRREIIYPGDKNSELLSSVIAMSSDSRGNILMGSSTGRIQVVRINGQNVGIIHTIEPEGKIVGNLINWIEADKHGFIWVGTNMGINRIRPEIINGQDTVAATFFGREYGYDELAVSASHICINGDIWIGGRSHLARIDVDMAKELKPEPRKVIIERIDLDHRVTDWQSIAVTDHWTNVPFSGLRLNYGQNNLSFYFGTTNIVNTGNTLYRYRVMGLNNQWSLLDDTRQVIYPNLPPGRYVLEVEAQLAWDIQTRGLSRFEFRIMPPWWQTWWFYTSLGILVILLFWIILLLRVRFIKKLATRKLKQEREISELRIRALQAQMNPHFTFNAINSIQYYILNKDKNSAFQFISYFSKLIRQTLEFASRNSVSIKEEISFIENYLKLEQMRFENKFEYKIDVDPSFDNHRQQIPPMLLQPFVENAILHGVMHKDVPGMIKIRFKLSNENSIHCIVEDNGVGRKRSAEINQGRHKSHRSIGLDITSRRLGLMNEAGSNDYGVEIADLYEDDGNPAGTRVEITIPLLTEAAVGSEEWD